jgi:RNA polymerase sigma factor (sigma-70 family)
MDGSGWGERLSGITTVWTLLRQAHAATADAEPAREALVLRYGGAVRRYLLAALHDEHAADELAQEFSLALVRGEFRGADPRRGRFRGYVKSVLFHLVSRYRRRQARGPAPVAPDDPALVGLAAPDEEQDASFAESWRQDLLARAWAALAEAHPASYAVLRLRAEHPEAPSQEMADLLGRRLSKAFTAAGVRQALRRAREQYADLLLEEVAHTLDDPTPAAVEEELADLRLLEYCRPALRRRHGDLGA